MGGEGGGGYSLMCLCGDVQLDGVLFLTSKTGNIVSCEAVLDRVYNFG